VPCLPAFYEFLNVRMLVTATLSSSFQSGEMLVSRFGKSVFEMNEFRIIKASEVWQISDFPNDTEMSKLY